MSRTALSAREPLAVSMTAPEPCLESNTPSDEALYARFLATANQDALNELVRRRHDAAYRVARCVCLNQSLAEEAVQDAFLRIVSERAQFEDRGPGSFRSWLLRIVANSARMARRSEVRALKKKKVDPLEYARSKKLDRRGTPEARAPRQEIAQRLEQTLDGMEERWRVPVVLHFVQGLPQKEIAGIVGVSQQMVSRRIEQGLEMLRMRLSQAGVACAIPVLTGWLAEGSLFQAPGSLAASVAAKAGAVAGVAAQESVRFAAVATGGKSALWAKVLAACVLLTAAGGVAWMAQSEPAAKAPEAPRLPAPEPEASTASRSWNFNAGLPPELVKESGEWSWEPQGGVDGTGAIKAGSSGLLFRLPQGTPPEAIVTVECRFYGLDTMNRGFSVLTQRADPAGTFMRCFQPMEALDGGRVSRLEAYVHQPKGLVSVLLNGEPYTEYGYAEGLEGGPLCRIFASSAHLDNLSVRPATDEDRARWERWRKERPAYDAYKDFDRMPLWHSGSHRVVWDGTVRYLPSGGVGGSGAIEGSRDPFFLASSAAMGRGIQLVRFDWMPRNDRAVQAQALNAFMQQIVIQPEAKVNFLDKNPQLTSPNELDHPAIEKNGGTWSPSLNEWHDVVFMIGSTGSCCIVDGRVFSHWTDARALQDVCSVLVRMEGRSRIDNLRVWRSVESSEALFKQFATWKAD